MARTMSGKAMIALASAAPLQRNIRVIPMDSSQRPAGPWLPKARRRSQPETTGGRTSGRWTRASSKTRPAKRLRASAHAQAKASGVMPRIAAALTLSERARMAHSGVESI
jgi:hypothetical protein